MSTKLSPFFLNHVRHPNKGLEPCHEVKSQAAQDFADNLAKVRTEAQSALTKAAEMMKTFYDKKWVDTRNHKKGDMVWLEGSNITTTQPSKKLGEKQYGPFEVLGKEGLTVYCLKLPATWKKIHPIDEPPHQIHSYTLLFLLFLCFLYIVNPPLCTSTPMWLHNNCTRSIRPISLIWWTHDLQFTCIYFYS